MFFEVPTIAIAFPEYREQASGDLNVKLVNPDEFLFALRDCLGSLKRTLIIDISSKVMIARANISRILEYGTNKEMEKIG